MKTFQLSAVLLFLTLCSTSCAEPRLTDASISTMLSDMQTAAARHDADALLSHFTADAKITFVMPATSGGTIHLSTNQYKGMLVEGWRVQSNSTYEVSDQKITIAADGKSAYATDRTRETVQMMGQMITSIANERVEIVLLKGEPKITSLSAVARQF